MKKTIVLTILGTLLSFGIQAQEYVQTTTNSAYQNKSFRTSGKFSIGPSDTELVGGSPLNIQRNWGNWMALVDGYKKDVYAFHNPNNGGRMEMFIHDGVTNTNNFGVFTIRRDGNIGIGTNSPQEKLHINGSIRGNASGGALKIKSTYGYIDVGAQNASWAHIYTDRPKIIFNKDIYTVTNGFSSYDNDLILKTKGTERIRIDDVTGNIGVGTTAPAEKLEIKDGRVLLNGLNPSIKIKNRTAGVGSWIDIAASPCNGCYSKFAKKGSVVMRAVSYKGDFIVSNPGNTSISFATGNWNSAPNPQQERMTITNIGNVGIGTKTPDAKLAVNGRIHAKEVKVDLTGWADYVFKENYSLPTLQQVENHIKTKGHLINIPSEAEVVENGIQLGEMNAKLLEKIEELTLYTISQQKEIDRLKMVETQNQKLAQRLAKIEALLENIKTNDTYGQEK